MLRKITGIIISLLLVSLTACSVSVDFTTLDFGSTETSKTFTLTIQGTVEWSIGCNESWVTINPDKDQGQGLYNINVTVDRTGLAIGDYEATLNISTTPETPCPDVIVKISVLNVSPVPSEVTGYVYEDGTSNSMSGALVSIGAKSSYSDGNGYYFISDVSTGLHTIKASKQGYLNYISTIDVIEDYTEHDIYMISEAASAPTVIISAVPSKIEKGGSSTLYWVSTDAISASITPDIGEVPVTGSYEVKEIESTTTYIITVDGPGGTTLRSVTVIVREGDTTTTIPESSAPEVAISAKPAIIEKGQSTTLLWAAKNAGSAVIDHGIGPVDASGGSIEVAPPSTVTYTITVQGTTGTASASTTVTVLEPVETMVEVISPNGGETWVPGTEETITWEATTAIGNVKIKLLYDDDSSVVIAASSPNDGEHSFTLLPEMLPEGYSPDNNSSFRINISDASDPAIYDKSNRTFTITPHPGIYAKTPGTLFAGQSGGINWKASPSINNVKIELIHTDDSENETIFPVADSVASALGTFNWENIPADFVGQRNRIKITSTDGTSVFDICGSDFDILGGIGISLKVPDGGETWLIGYNQTIEWEWIDNDPIQDITDVDIWITVDDSSNSYTTNNDGEFTINSFGEGWLEDPDIWTDPILKGRVKISSSNDPSIWSESADDFEIPITLGILYDKIIAALATVDSDRDWLPDEIEEFLGTDPENRDTDNDGINDYNEIFGFEIFDDYALIPDPDGDGTFAVLDPVEVDGDIQSWFDADNDNDGIPNYLEYYGYTYDWISDTYALWDGMSFDKPYFKTDPLQPSTDQDPYGDAMEASGNLMDVLVRSPGNLPMVPAYPNIVVRLEGYEVTLNAEITHSEGGALAEETNWSRQTTIENSKSVSLGWEVGGKFEQKFTYKFGVEGVGGETTIGGHANLSGNIQGTNSKSSSSSTGGSITEEENWEKATSSNPSEAARLKLKLKVYNYGTAAATNILPTLTMKIGGMNVLTFQPDNPIHILEPGGIYPPQQGTYWVVDQTGSTDDIHITIEELRAIECGAPVSIQVTQMSGEVMLLNADGQWESAGSWGEYMARCKAVCSNIMLDVGDGNFLHYLVYSDDSPTSPRVIFGDAMAWIAGLHATDSQIMISYLDQYGTLNDIPMENWEFVFDRETLLANGFSVADDQTIQAPGETTDLSQIVLGPDSVVMGLMSREDADDQGPIVYYATLDEMYQSVAVCASDYYGIENVQFIYENAVGTNEALDMEKLENRHGYYVLKLPDGYDYTHNTNEHVLVTSTDGTSQTEHDVKRTVYKKDPDPIPPSFDSLNILKDGDNYRVTATIVPGGDEWPVLSVWLWSEDAFEDVELEPHPLATPDSQWANQWYGEFSSDWVQGDTLEFYIIAETINGVRMEPELIKYTSTQYAIHYDTAKIEQRAPLFIGWYLDKAIWQDNETDICGDGTYSKTNFYLFAPYYYNHADMSENYDLFTDYNHILYLTGGRQYMGNTSFDELVWIDADSTYNDVTNPQPYVNIYEAMHTGGTVAPVTFVFKPKDYELDDKYVIIEFYSFNYYDHFFWVNWYYYFRWKQVVNPTGECSQN